MTAREWKPGDVAMARHERSFADDFLVVRTGLSSESYWSAPRDWPDGISSKDCIYRPLVVIDPEDREQVERLAAIFCAAPSSGWVSQMQEALREYAAPTTMCPSVLIFAGEEYPCLVPAPHDGITHAHEHGIEWETA